MEKAKAVLPDVTYVDHMNEVADGCDAYGDCDRMA